MYSSAVNILNVDPGGYSPCVALFTRTELLLSFTRSSHTSDMVFGSKSGFETRASMRPVSGSVTIIAPSYIPSAL